nr:MAG TPA: hypothetical protein [Caudoviricetes sp.]
MIHFFIWSHRTVNYFFVYIIIRNIVLLYLLK